MGKKTAKQRKSSGKRHGSQNLIGNTFRDKPDRINKKGRPKKLLGALCAELIAEGYEPVKETQVVEAYEILLNLPKDKVASISKSKEHPFFFTLVAKWMSTAQGMAVLKEIMDRAYGKTMMRASVDANIKTEQPLFPDQPNPAAKKE